MKWTISNISCFSLSHNNETYYSKTYSYILLFQVLFLISVLVMLYLVGKKTQRTSEARISIYWCYRGWLTISTSSVPVIIVDSLGKGSLKSEWHFSQVN